MTPSLSSSMRPSTITSLSNTQRTDFDRLSEKYWGEILERTLSSNSLHALQRNYGHGARNSNNIHYSRSSIHQNNNNNDHNPSNLLSNNNNFSDLNLNKTESNLYYSNSEPRLCEHDLHDINCAKNKAFFGAFNNVDDDI